MTRSWRQFHLSTAVLLMLTAALLMWLNVRPSRSWDDAVAVAKQIRPFPDAGDATHGGAPEAGDGSLPDGSGPQLEFVDFRIGGLYRQGYGWPWPALFFSWDLAPMVCVQPVEIPDAWRIQAIENGGSDLTFNLAAGEVERLFPDAGLHQLDLKNGTSAAVQGPPERQWSVGGVVGDALAALLILLVVGCCAEWLLRPSRGRMRTGVDDR